MPHLLVPSDASLDVTAEHLLGRVERS